MIFGHRVHDSLRPLYEAIPGRHYTGDFDKHDRAALTALALPGVTLFFIASDMGTHLLAHPVDAEQIACLVRLYPNAKAWQVRVGITTDRIDAIALADLGRAMRASAPALVLRQDWTSERGAKRVVVRRDDVTVASATVTLTPQDATNGAPHASVAITAGDDTSPADVVCAQRMTFDFVSQLAGTLFWRCSKLTVNDRPLEAWIAERLAPEIAAAQDVARSLARSPRPTVAA